MPTVVFHQPRVAWDFASAAVGSAGAADDTYRWFGARVAELLGPAAAGEFGQTRVRLSTAARPDTRHIELGRWRVYIEDALRTVPGLGGKLAELIDEAAARR